MTKRSLTRNAIYNGIGTLVPLLLALVTIPLFLSRVGEARYGIIALVWLLFGYFGLFDMGLSQATSNQLAKVENQSAARQSELFWLALLTNASVGSLVGACFFLFGEPLVLRVASVPVPLIMEIHHALPWIALLIGLSTISGVFSGTLESRERFLELNVLGVVGSSLGQIAPLVAVILFGASVENAIAATACMRLATLLPLAVMAIRQSGIGARPRFRISTMKGLFAYGGWITVSNAVSPLLVSADQFMIASVLGVRAVAHYSIPFNLALKILIVPRAMTVALFPVLSRSSAAEGRRQAESTAVRMGIALALLCGPALFLTEDGLRLWLGASFSAEASAVTRVILLGVWINGIATIPYIMLQAQGRPDLPAKLHVLELLPFLGLLWICVQTLGLRGAAIAWVLRVSVDAILLARASEFSSTAFLALLPSASAVLIAYAAACLCAGHTLASVLGAMVTLIVVGAAAVRSDPRLATLMSTIDFRWTPR